jgi:hypothetical protein
MRKSIRHAAITMVALNLLTAVSAQAEPSRTTLPENLDKFVHYTTIRRGEVTEHILTTPEALAAIKNGQPAPDGTHVILVDYRDGEVFRYFVMENGKNWGADYPEGQRTGDWHFKAFKPDRTVNTAENPARCQSCHSSASDRQFLFTFDALHAFDGTAVD